MAFTDFDERGNDMHFVDKLGWPVETIKGRPVLNFLRILIHTARIRRGKFHPTITRRCEDADTMASVPGRLGRDV